jgi:ABC-2 type transport system ATP-binding protein
VAVLVVQDVTRASRRAKERHLALDGVTMVVDAGEIVGLVGSNGAGKTTLLRLVAGELSPTKGAVFVAGRRAGTRAARRLVGFAPDPPVAPPELTGAEWLRYCASYRAESGGARARAVALAIELGGLGEFAGRRIGTYPRGAMLRLALATAAFGAPPLLALDETLGGVDPLAQIGLRETIARLARGGAAVIVSSHDLGALERLITRVVLLASGRIGADFAIADVLRERVAELVVTGTTIGGLDRVLRRFPAAHRTGSGVHVPLTRGLTIEAVLAACQEERVAVAGSRIRYRALEDALVTAARGNGAAPG